MNNRNKRQIKKLISGLCAIGTLGSTYTASPVMAAETDKMSKYLGKCLSITAMNAANEFPNYVTKGVLPYFNRINGFEIAIGEPNSAKENEDEYGHYDNKIMKYLPKQIIEKGWDRFVEETITEFRNNCQDPRGGPGTFDALEAALKAIGPQPKLVTKSLTKDDKTTIGPAIPGLLNALVLHPEDTMSFTSTWYDAIIEKLEWKMNKFEVGLATAAGIAAAGGAIYMVQGAIHDHNTRKIAKEAIEAKKKHQRREDELAKEFAEKVDIDAKKINIEKLITMLENEAKDWPYAKEELRVFIDTYVGILECKQTDPLAKCPPIILVGKPGCGKTEWIKRVIKCTFECIEDPTKPTSAKSDSWREKCILINQDKIDNNSSISARDQISGTHEEKREDVTVTCYSDSAKANKFGTGIHLKYIDEIEKLLIDVILGIWDTADSGGRAVVLATGNGNPADYIQGGGADFKEAFEDRAIILEIPQPDKAYIRTSIMKLISEINEHNPDKSPIVVSDESLAGLVDACRSMRSVATMKSPILGLQKSKTRAGLKVIPIKINPKTPKPERIILDTSYNR